MSLPRLCSNPYNDLGLDVCVEDFLGNWSCVYPLNFHQEVLDASATLQRFEMGCRIEVML